MVDRIRPLKLEDTTTGSSVNFTPTEADPTQDYIATKGVSYESSNTYTQDLSSDLNVQTVSFASVVMSKFNIPNDLKDYVVSDLHQAIIFDHLINDGLITLNGDIVIL